MPFEKVNIKDEVKKLKQDKEFEKAYTIIDKEYKIIEKAIKLRKELEISQQKVSEESGLTQQMISRIEKVGHSPVLRNFIRYLDGAGLEIKICKKRKQEKLAKGKKAKGA